MKGSSSPTSWASAFHISTGPGCGPGPYFRLIQAAPFSGWYQLKNIPVIFLKLSLTVLLCWAKSLEALCDPRNVYVQYMEWIGEEKEQSVEK